MTRTNTSYTAQVNGQGTETRSRKGAAIAIAEALFAENGGRFAAEVVTQAGTVVFRLEPTVTETGRAKPNTRTENPKFDARVPAGFVVRYVRNRIKAVIAQNPETRAWVVVTPHVTHHVANTIEAREITNGLQKARLEARAAAAAEAKETVAA